MPGRPSTDPLRKGPAGAWSRSGSWTSPHRTERAGIEGGIVDREVPERDGKVLQDQLPGIGEAVVFDVAAAVSIDRLRKGSSTQLMRN